MEVTNNCNDYRSRVKKIIRVKMSKIQGRKYSRYEIKFWYSDLV